MIDFSKQPIAISPEEIKKKCIEVKRYFEHHLAENPTSHIEINFNPFEVFPLWIVMLAIIRAAPKIVMKWARWILIERWNKREAEEGRKEYGIFKGIPGIR